MSLTGNRTLPWFLAVTSRIGNRVSLRRTAAALRSTKKCTSLIVTCRCGALERLRRQSMVDHILGNITERRGTKGASRDFRALPRRDALVIIQITTLREQFVDGERSELAADPSSPRKNQIKRRTFVLDRVPRWPATCQGRAVRGSQNATSASRLAPLDLIDYPPLNARGFLKRIDQRHRLNPFPRRHRHHAQERNHSGAALANTR